MNWGGIISGALGGAAGAVKEIGDTNLKLRQAEEAQARERQFRREDALWEMDQKLARLPQETKAKAEAEIAAEGMKLDAKNKRRASTEDSIINRELSGSVIGDESTWTPEQEAARNQGMEARRAELRDDPKVRQQVGLQMGELTEKDIMADDRNRDIAQLRAEVANAKTEQQREIAQARLDQALQIANMRIAAGSGSGGAGETRAERLTAEAETIRKAMDSTTDRKLKEEYRVRLNRVLDELERRRNGDDKPSRKVDNNAGKSDNPPKQTSQFKVGETRTVQNGPNKGKTARWDGKGWVLVN